MFGCSHYGAGCPIGMIISVIAWWLVASALLYFTWNHVVAALTSAKQAKFWHALLVVATLAAFCAPRMMCKGKHGWKKGCPGYKGAIEAPIKVQSESEGVRRIR